MLLKLISCGSLALVSVLVVTLLQGLRQHNQRIHALQERIDQASFRKATLWVLLLAGLNLLRRGFFS